MIVVGPKRWGGMKPPVGAQISPGHPLAAGLALCFLLNETAGAVTRDLASGLSASFVNGPVWAAGLDSGVSFAAASNQYLDAGSGVSPDAWPGITIASRFVVTDQTAERGLCYRNNAGAAHTLNFCTNQNNTQANRVCAFLGGTAWCNSTSTIAANVWVQAAGVSTPSGQRIFLNGKLDASDSIPYSPSTAGQPWRIGAARNNVGNINGIIGYVYVWQRALTPQELQWVYQEPYAFLQPQSPQRRFWLPVAIGNQQLTMLGVGA